jgi:hypothetical protein
LGGEEPITITGYNDASLGKGTKGRSITGELVKLNEKAGSILSKSHNSTVVFTSVFEAELEAIARNVKHMKRISNVLHVLGIQREPKLVQYCDNKATVDFVLGESEAKGVRHMNLRLWYIRESFHMGEIDITHLEGKKMVADMLTKVGTVDQFKKFVKDIMGHELLPYMIEEVDEEE